jgi:hypothetical protein
LIVVAAALLLVGVQGTPLVKLGGESANIQLESRRIIERVVDRVAERSSPEVARPILEALSQEGDRLSAYPRHVSAAIYTLEVQAALLRSGAQTVSHLSVDYSRADLNVVYPVPGGTDLSLDVMIKYFSESAHISRRFRDFRSTLIGLEGMPRLTPLMIVANRDFNPPREPVDERTRFVLWNGPQDDAALAGALSEMAAKK